MILQTEQEVTDRTCIDYQRREEWREAIVNWREILTSEEALAAEEARVEDAEYV